MRFDDTLATVLAAEPTTPASAQAVWRQVVDLIGRGRAPADDAALATLARIARDVPVGVRAASARALFGAQPPAALVRLLALDDIAVGAPALRSAILSDDDWTALLPALSPTARAVLRHRRDLTPAVTRGLASFGATDFVLGADADMTAAPAADPVAPVTIVPDNGPFQPVGAIALGLPVVAEALRRENDNEAPPASEEGGFRIADVVARLEAFQRERDAGSTRPEAVSAPAPLAEFRFETDVGGTIRWAEGISRGAVIGIDLSCPARPNEPGVDGTAAGAFRRRDRFRDAHLSVAGGVASGAWLMSGIPLFDSATGRFIGYRGVARRPQRHETAMPLSDSLRQLVHELRTPTNAIAGFSEMIEHAMLGPVAEPYRAHAGTMRGDAGNLLAAIDDVDTAARIDARALALRPEATALQPLLARVAADLTPLATARRARLDLSGADAVVVADLPTLERLLARTVGAMLGAADVDETIAIRTFAAAGGRVGLAVARAAALDAYPGEAVLAIDDEESPASLLGIGFALRLARNLARELGGAMTIGHRNVTLYLPVAADRVLDRAL